MPIITLLTDFGVNDEFVGVMKGVILSIHPAATVVDITHDIDPQDIIQAAYLVKSSYAYFPEDTVHLVVVDPGVGSDRSIVALKTERYYFVCPDNGVLTLLLEEENIRDVVRLDNDGYFLHPVSRTFHGRDIFAPVGAHLSRGLPLCEMGTPMDLEHLARVPLQKPYMSRKGELIGELVLIDRFGNLMTNIDSDTLKRYGVPDSVRSCSVHIGDAAIEGVSKSYSSVGHCRPLAIVGSRGYLEIAVNGGNAADYFKAQKGDGVNVVWIV